MNPILNQIGTVFIPVSNIEEAHNWYEYMQKKNVTLTPEIEHDHWFTFKDPDGNHLMICKC